MIDDSDYVLIQLSCAMQVHTTVQMCTSLDKISFSLLKPETAAGELTDDNYWYKVLS